MYKLDNRFIIWLAVLLLLAVGCRDQTPNADDQPLVELESTPTAEPTGRGIGGTLQILYWDAPQILNTHLTGGTKDFEAGRITYEPLATFDKDGNLIPILAAEVPTVENGQVGADGKSVTWKLKQDLQWSDGEPFTAEDVRFTYQFITNPDVKSFSIGAYTAVQDVVVIDDNTIRIDFSEATPVWFDPFVGSSGIILPRHKFEAYNGTNAREAPANTEAVGTGPYRALSPGIKPQETLFLGTQLVQTNKIVFEPNPYFREEDKPYFSRVEVRGGGTPSEAARLVLQAGEVDYGWSLSIPAERLTELEQGGQGKVVPTFGTTVDQLEPNFTDPNQETADGERSSTQFPHPFFSDLKVRQALAHAIDREKIIKLYGPIGRAIDYLLVSPPQYRSTNKGFYDFDLVKAANLLDEAGWVDHDGDNIRDKDGLKLALLFQTTVNETRQATQRIIKEDLESIGFEVELKIVDASIFYGSNLSNPDHNGRFLADLQETDWSRPTLNPGVFLGYWTCDLIPTKANNWSRFNYRRWCNPEYDALYEQSKTELDPEKRRMILIRMNDILTEDVATIPLAQQARVSAINNTLEGFDPTPWDAETWNIKDWRRSP
ncbi:peptide ABC transporter substrate-binding protein [Anaerolineales bacterium HSG24]|nr:peptide ABC transporter substrate-binding protein [Anaerolineales bacterium HSG24]